MNHSLISSFEQLKLEQGNILIILVEGMKCVEFKKSHCQY